MFSSFKNVCIKKIAVALPSRKVSYDDEFYEEVDQAKKQKLKSIIGFNQRYVSQQETTLDLCEEACKKLSLDFETIDAIVFVTQTPDYFQPGNAHVLHGRLNFRKECFCIDINAGCNGYLTGLLQAHQLLQQEEVNNVVLCAGDTISKTVDPKDASTAPIFGDGGSATLLVKKKGCESFFSFQTNGKKFDQLIIKNGAHKMDDRSREAGYLYMNGAEVMQMAITEVPQSIEDLLLKYKFDKEEIDFYFFHQANNFIVETLAKNLQLPMEKVPLIFSLYGNQSSASIPFAIVETLNKSKPGICLLSGFGVGFAWANAIVDLTDVEIIYN